MPQRDAIHLSSPRRVRAGHLAAQLQRGQATFQIGRETSDETARQRVWKHAPNTLSSYQTLIVKERESTFDW